MIEKSRRIQLLPRYLFAKIDEAKARAVSEGMDVIDMGIGDPDIPTPLAIVDELCEAARNPANHRYPSYEGMLEFREAVANWFRSRFNVDLDPTDEVLVLIGSKDGIGHIPLAFLDKGDYALIPDPGYPVYKAGVILSGGITYSLPLLSENGFLPDLDGIDRDVARKAKLIFLNYPNNPTAAVADIRFFERVVEFAKANDTIVCHDAAYSELGYDGYKAPSFLEAKGAKDIAVEFHSLSKTYNMTGWRIGFAVGNPDILAGLRGVKNNLDSGVFKAIQYAGIQALRSGRDSIARVVAIYRKRRDILVNGLRDLGWSVPVPKAAFYVWIPVPEGYTSASFCEVLLSKAGVVVTPGAGFGEHGEGYVRTALTVDEARLTEALKRIGRLKWD
jgi:LL-diaminopimelate aminotransferase